MKVTPEAIARAGLELLNEVGLDGLTMRLVAERLGVRAPTLYWHVKNKQELLDAMAQQMLGEVNEGVEGPGRDVSWQDWTVDLMARSRRVMLGYRDGARVLAGSYTSEPLVWRTLELALRTLRDGGVPLDEAARAVPVLLHYTVGFTIEEQARTGAAYEGRNPYAEGDPVPAEKYPLLASAAAALYGDDPDTAFTHGLRVILTGLGSSC